MTWPGYFSWANVCKIQHSTCGFTQLEVISLLLQLFRVFLIRDWLLNIQLPPLCFLQGCVHVRGGGIFCACHMPTMDCLSVLHLKSPFPLGLGGGETTPFRALQLVIIMLILQQQLETSNQAHSPFELGRIHTQHGGKKRKEKKKTNTTVSLFFKVLTTQPKGQRIIFPKVMKRSGTEPGIALTTPSFLSKHLTFRSGLSFPATYTSQGE